jgi:hypothetical protein
MGHGILYCATCQEQLRDADFDKELAYRLEGQSFCEKCARELIHTLPEDRVNDILRTFESTHDDPPPAPPIAEHHGNRTTRILKALSSSPGIRLTSTSRRMATVPPDPQASSSLLVGIGITVFILVVLAIYGVASDSSSAKHSIPVKSGSRR